MSAPVDAVTVGVFLLVLALTALSGWVISRWQTHGGGGLEEWGLGSRQFGTIVTWFLVGGDFYTAYTIIAVPALVFATGGAGFFALPYTIIVYPFVFATMPRLWAVSRRHGLVTPADFVRVRYGSHWLASAVALTGIASLMPYIALQFTGMEAVLAQMGLTGDTALLRSLPVVIAFIAVAGFTFAAGLRAPALIAFAKDIMIYIVVIAAVLLLPRHFGGYHTIFTHAAAHFAQQKAGAVILQPSGFSAYATLALGSALAAFLYPHTVTSVLASSSAKVIRKNAVLLPAYTVLLGLVALLGIVGAAAGLKPHTSKDVVPVLFTIAFPHWFLGFAFAAITVAALVPATCISNTCSRPPPRTHRATSRAMRRWLSTSARSSSSSRCRWSSRSTCNCWAVCSCCRRCRPSSSACGSGCSTMWRCWPDGRPALPSRPSCWRNRTCRARPIRSG
jgi:SSS family solute:Na+ symporter